MGGVIDWGVARMLAIRVSGAPGPVVLDGLAEASREAAERVAAYTSLQVPGGLPEAEAVDREAWVDANLRSLGTILDPVAERLGDGLGPLAGPGRVAIGLLLGAEVGLLSGLLSQRVLGQYEFPLLAPAAPARLLYVAPNLAEAARSLGAAEQDVVRWVALHECTHGVQFGGVPWLREHFAGLVRGMLETVKVDPRALMRLPSGDDLRVLVGQVREDGLLALVASPAQREVMDRVQAMMSLLEGHAEHVMDAVGADVLPNLPELRAGLERRRESRPAAWRILERLLGLELKMRQYRLGKVFVDAVVAKAGIAGLNRAFEAPELLPTLSEIEDPDAWLARVTPLAA